MSPKDKPEDLTKTFLGFPVRLVEMKQPKEPIILGPLTFGGIILQRLQEFRDRLRGQQV